MQRLATDTLALPAAAPAAHLYDMACLYALAAETGEVPEWRRRAACLLVQALAADPPPRRLWNSAPDDPQLRVLHVYMAAFKAAVSSEPVSSGGNIARGLDVDGIVQRAFSAHADQAHPRGS